MKFRRSKFRRTAVMRRIPFVVMILCWTACSTKAAPSPDVAKRCEQGLQLHGRGQWSAALEVFADAVGNAISSNKKDLETISDCVFGAALSLNTLGMKEDSLTAFKLAQRLLEIHPTGAEAAASKHMQACRDWSASRSSLPYMSCNSARAGADFLHDALDGAPCRFLPSIVKPGSVVYVNALLLDDFFVNKHPYIRAKYALVTHCSDADAPAMHDHYLADPRLAAWFAQNPDLSFHPKLHPLPIGLANKDFAHGDTAAMSRAREQVARDGRKTGWLYVNVDPSTSPDRGRALAALEGKDFVSPPVTERQPFPEYLRHLASHREALLLRSIPVVASSPLDSLFASLPVLIVDDWDEVTWELLQATWERVSANASAFDAPSLLAPYWHHAFRDPPVREAPAEEGG